MSSGALIPGSLVTSYRFSYDDLLRAVGNLYQSTDAKLPPLKDLLPSVDIDVSWPETRTEVDFESMGLLLTYVHEQFHVKHLSASPLGFVLWSLQAQYYDTASALLAKWGAKQSSSGLDLSLPLVRDGELDEELEQIKIRNGARSTAIYSLRQQERFGTRDASNALLPGIFEMLQDTCERLFGSRGEIPHFKMPTNEDQPLDLGGMSSEAIIEGFARTNEYLLLQRMEVPQRVIRRSKLLRNHGIYVLASTTVEHLLEIPADQVDAVTARLCDWAMQAPILPVLCQGRGEIGLNELLPNWRFGHLTSAAKRLALTAKDFIETPQETEELLFGELGWMTPTAVATLLSKLPPGNASGEQTKLVRNKITLGAQARLTNPDALAMPGEDDDRRLRSGISFFNCGAFLPTGNIEDFADWRIFVRLLLEDQVVDTLCLGTSFATSRWLAAKVGEFYNVADHEGVLREVITKQVGETVANELLAQDG